MHLFLFLSFMHAIGIVVFSRGGYVAFEFANVAVRAGVQARIAHRGARLLPRFDPDLVDQLVKSSRELGVDVQLGTEVTGVEKSSGQLIVRVSAFGQQHTFEADMVVHAAGRVPEIDDMNLDAAQVAWDG